MNWYNVGKIVNTHGVRGEVRVISHTDFEEERFQEGAKLFVLLPGQKEKRELIVNTHRTHKQFHLLSFKGMDTLNEVEDLKEGMLQVPESERIALDEHEYYHDDIIGCSVFTDKGQYIGKVKEILQPGANDVWVVKNTGDKQDVLIPYIEDVVRSVHIEKQEITIVPMKGLLPE